MLNLSPEWQIIERVDVEGFDADDQVPLPPQEGITQDVYNVLPARQGQNSALTKAII